MTRVENGELSERLFELKLEIGAILHQLETEEAKARDLFHMAHNDGLMSIAHNAAGRMNAYRDALRMVCRLHKAAEGQ